MIISKEEYDKVLLRLHATAQLTLSGIDEYQFLKVKAIAVTLLNLLLEKKYWLAEDFMDEANNQMLQYDYRSFALLEDANLLKVKKGLVGVIYMFNQDWQFYK